MTLAVLLNFLLHCIPSIHLIWFVSFFTAAHLYHVSLHPSSVDFSKGYPNGECFSSVGPILPTDIKTPYSFVPPTFPPSLLVTRVKSCLDRVLQGEKLHTSFLFTSLLLSVLFQKEKKLANWIFFPSFI